MRKLDRGLFAASLLLALFGIVVAVDLVQAIGAAPCPAPGCYP